MPETNKAEIRTYKPTGNRGYYFIPQLSDWVQRPPILLQGNSVADTLQKERAHVPLEAMTMFFALFQSPIFGRSVLVESITIMPDGMLLVMLCKSSGDDLHWSHYWGSFDSMLLKCYTIATGEEVDFLVLE